MTTTKIFAHRGSSGTHPENTMAAFIEAERVGADGIELDVHYTKDDEIVVIHDNTLNRTTNGKGSIRDHTLEQLKKLDAGSSFARKFKGEKIPTLIEVLDWIVETDILLNIELKYIALDYIDFEEKVLIEVEKRNLTDRTIISSFNHHGIRKVHELNSQIECAILYMERLYEPWYYAKNVGAQAIHPYLKGIDPVLIAQSEQLGYPMRVFTVNKKKQIEGLLKVGSSGIITDFPERAIQIRNKFNG